MVRDDGEFSHSIREQLFTKQGSFMHTVFLIPYPPGPPGSFVVFGSDENGPASIHVFTDEVLVSRMKNHLPPLSVAAAYTSDQLRQLIEACPYTHVCIDQTPASIVPVDSFLRTLAAENN